MMDLHSLKRHGYWLSALPIALFVLSTMLGMPWLVIVFFFALMPLVRIALPDDPAEPLDTEQIFPWQVRLLDAIPWVLVACWAVVLPWSIFVLRNLSDEQVVGFVLGLWVVMSLYLPVAHELLHRRSLCSRIAARLVAGSVGYFQMIDEHQNHHAKNGLKGAGDSADIGESLYAYAARRYLRSFTAAHDWEMRQRLRKDRTGWSNRIALTALPTVAVMAAFASIAGARGIAVYACLIVGSSFSLQAITYIQHWGLTDCTSSALREVGYSWEDRCWVQACVTLNLAYHGHHHLRPTLPYYRLVGLKRAPVLPASYPVMFVAALIPPVFERVMHRRLERWLAGDDVSRAAKNHSCADIDEFFRA